MSLTASNAQVYKGTAAVTYGGGPGDPTTVLLMHCDGTNGGTSFTDSSSYNQTITNAGSVVTSTAAQKFGTASFYTNGTVGNYYLSVTSSVLMFGTGDFTIEFWMNPSDPVSTTRNQRLMGNLPLGSYNSGAWAIGFNTGDSGKLHIDINNVINGWTATTAQVAGTWYHIALVRSGSTWYFFQNGVLQSTTTSTASFDNGGAARPVYIGWSGYSTTITNEYYNGYLDEIRFTYGKALYTANFTVSTIPFVASPSTALSLPGITGSFMDFSTVPVARVNTSTTSMFLETWCYFNTLTGVEQYIAGTITISTQANDDWGLRWNSGSNRIQFYHYNAGSATSLAAPNAGQWYHVAVSVVTGNPGYVYLFVNGVLQNSGGSSMSGAPRYTAASTLWLGSPGNTGWGPSNVRIQDLRVVSGGTVPTTSFTPAAAPFGLASPSYVSGGTTVLSLATQYYQTTTNGLLPQVFLAPSGTYPSYTTTSAPVFSSSNVAFTGAGFSAGNFINFGQTTITMALGYSIVFQFAWTGSYQSAYERIFDFGVAGGNSNAIIVYRNGTGSTINFGNFTGTSAQTITSTSTFPQNTVSGTVVCIYDPASTGSLKMYVNGSLQATLTGITIIPNGSFPSSLIAATNATGADPFSNVSIYSMKFYNRVLSATEIARTASPISSIQFTSRPIFAPVLVSPGNQTFVGSGTFSVEQTALQPLNGITWSARPLGLISLVSSTDHLIKFSVASTLLFSNTFTVIATNKAGLSSVVQFIVSVTPVQPILTNMALWINPSTYPGTGTTITDSSGNGRTFTFAGTPLPVYVASPVPAFSFIRNSAFSTYNRLERNSIFLGDDMTIQAWIKTTYVGQDTWHYLLMTIMATEVGGPGNDWGFGVNNSGKLAFGAGTSDTTIASTSSVNTGTWINVAATRVKSSGLITLYINGSSNGSGTGNAGNSLTSATIVWIGSGQDGGYSFGGLIGEVLAYTSALSASDVAYNFNISRSTYGV